MEISKLISAIDTHTAGEPTRVVTGGIPNIPGKTMREKKNWMQKNLDHVRTALLWEPRGHKDMFGAIITAPTSDDAEIGIIFMDGGGYLDMCGHGSIGAVTALVETGMICRDRPTNGILDVTLDTPAGKILAKVTIENKKIKSITIQNVPAFLYASTSLVLPELGEIPVHISYGGNFFALVNARDLNIELLPQNIKTLQEIGLDIRDRINKAHKIIHPESGQEAQVALVEIYTDGEKPKNVVIFGESQIDRSPCGTGTCAKMAFLHAQGRLPLGQKYEYRSLFDTVFIGKLLAETMVGEKQAVIPEIEGQAFITGINQYALTEDDPLKHGFYI